MTTRNKNLPPLNPNAMRSLQDRDRSPKTRLTLRGKVALGVATALAATGAVSAVEAGTTYLSDHIDSKPLVVKPGEPTFNEEVRLGDVPESVTARIASNNGSHDPGKMTDYVVTFEHNGVLEPGTEIPIPADKYHEIPPNPSK